MKQTSRFFAIAILVCVAVAAHAQSTELAVTGGGNFASSGSFSVDPSFAIEGSVAHRLISAPLVSLYAEVPIAAAFDATPQIVSAIGRFNYSSLFVTPGVKLKFTTLGVDPYFVLGGGVGRFSQTTTIGTTSSSDSTTTGVVSFGGGADFHVAPFLALRGEVRDYYSGVPRFGLAASGRQHNVFTTGGIVLRF
jgi:hypothetical protein